MAKQGKAQGARRPAARFDDSALLRSAETLGRVIGALQRQLDGAARRLIRPAPAPETVKAADRPLYRNNGHARLVVKPRKRKAAGTKTARTVTPKSAGSRPRKAKGAKTTAKRSSRRS